MFAPSGVIYYTADDDSDEIYDTENLRWKKFSASSNCIRCVSGFKLSIHAGHPIFVRVQPYQLRSIGDAVVLGGKP